MGDDAKSFEHQLILVWAKRVNHLLETGAGGALLVILARFISGSSAIKLGPLPSIPLRGVWLFFALATIAHIFFSYFFAQSITDMRKRRSEAEQISAREDVIVNGGIFVAVAMRRIPKPGQRIVRMSPKDASALVAHGAAIALLLAVLPWWWENGLKWPGWGRSLIIATIGLVLIAMNWSIGGLWAMKLSELGTSITPRDSVEPKQYVMTPKGMLPPSDELAGCMGIFILSITLVIGAVALYYVLI